MIDIPLDKALVAVEDKEGDCNGCLFDKPNCCSEIACYGEIRSDGKSVIYKLVDLPEKETNVRFDAIRSRAEKLGVLGIEVDGNESVDAIDCFEHTLDIIEQNKEILDRNAGEKAGAGGRVKANYSCDLLEK